MPLRSLSPLYGKKILLLTHAGADVDSLASAAALMFALKGKSAAAICVPEHLNLSAKALASNLSIPFKINLSMKGFDAVVCLDFNKPSMLGPMAPEFRDFKGEKFLVDHHVPEKATYSMVPEKNCFTRKSAVSTTELVFELLKNSRVKIPRKSLLCIASGIVADSASFLVADHSTFRIMSEIILLGKTSYAEILGLFSVKKDFSQKIASLKAAKRCRIFRGNDSIIAIAEIGSFEADAAASLVRVGADAAFCGYADKGKIRVSGRANNSWLRREKLDLARDVFARLEKFFPGEGGGHAGAAGFNGEGDEIMKYLEKCAELLNEKLSHGKKNSGLKEYT